MSIDSNHFTNLELCSIVFLHYLALPINPGIFNIAPTAQQSK